MSLPDVPVKVGVRLFRAKIGEDNQASLELFAKLGYQRVRPDAHGPHVDPIPLRALALPETSQVVAHRAAQVSYSSVFKEVTLEWVPPADTIASAGAKLVFGVYDREADG